MPTYQLTIGMSSLKKSFCAPWATWSYRNTCWGYQRPTLKPPEMSTSNSQLHTPTPRTAGRGRTYQIQDEAPDREASDVKPLPEDNVGTIRGDRLDALQQAIEALVKQVEKLT